jgi:hypothetical protein
METSSKSRPSSPADTLTTIRQMLATLDTVTTAGQRHLMNKMLAIMGDQVERALGREGPRNEGTLREQLVLLKREVDRHAPSASEFVNRAEGLIALVRKGGA